MSIKTEEAKIVEEYKRVREAFGPEYNFDNWLTNALATYKVSILAECEKEKIICSAVRFNEKVWMGHRHGNALEAMHGELSYTMNRKEMNEAQTDRDQGFVTSTGRYVGREEGWIIAKEAEQIIKRDYQMDGTLFSEDLW